MKQQESHTVDAEAVEIPAPLGGTTFADEIAAAKIEAGKRFIKGAAYFVFFVTVAFLGVFNFMLYARAFDDPTAKLLAILPAVTISGSVLLLTFANIRWFSIGSQSVIGKWAGYGLFGIEAANAVTEWTLVNGWLDASSPAIRIYAQFGIPLALVTVALVYKLLIDSDEESEAIRDHNLTAAMIRKRKQAAVMAFLDDPTLTARIVRAGQVAARRLTEAHTVDADAEPVTKSIVMAKDDGARNDADGQAGDARPLDL